MKTLETPATVRRMVVDPASAVRHSEFRGQTYYFCSAHFRQKFDADLAKALPAKVAADKKARVESSVKNIAKLAEDLDKTGDDNNLAGTEANLKKLDGVLMALDSRLSNPPPFPTTPVVSGRFAKRRLALIRPVGNASDKSFAVVTSQSRNCPSLGVGASRKVGIGATPPRRQFFRSRKDGVGAAFPCRDT